MANAVAPIRLDAAVTVLERGWLSSNNILLRGENDEGATLIDSGHSRHAPQTLALVTKTLHDALLTRIVNTHLHSDHCGGNALLQRHLHAQVFVPSGSARAASVWDEAALTFAHTGQHCERFNVDGALLPGQTLRAGGRDWLALAAPGHDPDALLLFDPRDGVLISGDALWAHGFGIVFPELAGQSAFDHVAATLDLIATLPVRQVIPGHGAVFTDVKAALARARSRLDGFQHDPARHARHAGKALLMYHLMEVGGESPEALHAWLQATPLMPIIHARSGQAGHALAWYDTLADELLQQGHLRSAESRLVPA